MNTLKNLQDKIDASLNSLDGVQRATPSPFFYTRVIGKLMNQQQSFWEKFSAVITRPVVAFSCMSVIVLMNVIAVYTNSDAATMTENDVVASDELTTQVTPGFYDLENSKP